MELLHRHTVAGQGIVEHLVQKLFVGCRVFCGVTVDPAGCVHDGQQELALLDAIEDLDAGLVDADSVGRYVLWVAEDLSGNLGRADHRYLDFEGIQLVAQTFGETAHRAFARHIDALQG